MINKYKNTKYNPVGMFVSGFGRTCCGTEESNIPLTGNRKRNGKKNVGLWEKNMSLSTLNTMKKSCPAVKRFWKP
jgi:hypothetical protein